MGLLSDVLPYIYSRSNALKRQVSDFVQNPKEGLLNIADNVKRDVQGARQMVSDATNESVASIKAGGRAFGGPADQKMAQALANNYNPMQMIVWHGSPHKFAKFDSSKIGTGEGAQAYGHGIYLAEAPDVAAGYRASVVPKDQKQFGLDDGPIKGIANLIAARGERGEQMARQAYASQVPNIDEAIKAARQAVDRSSSLYKVDLPDPLIARMLDWDKPLSQQDQAVQAVARRLGLPLDKAAGENLHKAASFAAGNADTPRSAAAAASMLRDAGIPGIRYLDGGSRGAGAGTSNFVIFPGEENALRILERNGQPLGLLDVR